MQAKRIEVSAEVAQQVNLQKEPVMQSESNEKTVTITEREYRQLLALKPIALRALQKQQRQKETRARYDKKESRKEYRRKYNQRKYLESKAAREKNRTVADLLKGGTTSLDEIAAIMGIDVDREMENEGLSADMEIDEIDDADLDDE
jgi:hypothetical protein